MPPTPTVAGRSPRRRASPVASTSFTAARGSCVSRRSRLSRAGIAHRPGVPLVPVGPLPSTWPASGSAWWVRVPAGCRSSPNSASEGLTSRTSVVTPPVDPGQGETLVSAGSSSSYSGVPALGRYWDRRMSELKVKTDGSENWRLRPGPEREEMTHPGSWPRWSPRSPTPCCAPKLTPDYQLGWKRSRNPPTTTG